ncbi:MAG: site-specific integrase [Desulfovibrio sp.]|jgi:integrase|nr:site-specific integrase [Desulfovibrio sp.]
MSPAARQKRHGTGHAGVYYRWSATRTDGERDRIFCIIYRVDGKVREESVGWERRDGMTADRAAGIRDERRTLPPEPAPDVLADIPERRDGKPSVAALLSLYRKARPTRAWAADMSNYKLHLMERFGHRTPEELTTLDLDTLVASLREQGKSPQTICHVLGLLRRTINFGARRGLCPPIDGSKLFFDMPKVDNERTETLSPEQLKRYAIALNEEPDQTLASMLRLALVTGMRRGALMALEWDDLDFDQKFITLRGANAKKGKTERIPMSTVAEYVLRNVPRTESRYVFPGRQGMKRVEARGIANRVKERAGLPAEFRPFHGLRHAFASFLASSGKVDIYTLQKLLTHSTHAMTQRYAHLADETLQRAAGVTDEVFGKVAGGSEPEEERTPQEEPAWYAGITVEDICFFQHTLNPHLVYILRNISKYTSMNIPCVCLVPPLLDFSGGAGCSIQARLAAC